MNTYINKEILELKEKLRENKKLESLKKAKEEELSKKKIQIQELKEILEKERQDIEKLENGGISSMLLTLLGKREEKLDKEKEEYFIVKLKSEDFNSKIDKLENELTYIKNLLTSHGDINKRYEELIKEKERLIIREGGSQGIKLKGHLANIDKLKIDMKEIDEAIASGKKTLNSLNGLRENLQSAQNWGVWDILGGGLISNIGKHSAIDDANDIARDVQEQLKSFKKELSDVNEFTHIEVNLSSFASFADFFLDGIFADWFVQSKINNSLDNVNSTISVVDKIINDLNRSLKGLKENLIQSEVEVEKILES